MSMLLRTSLLFIALAGATEAAANYRCTIYNLGNTGRTDPMAHYTLRHWDPTDAIRAGAAAAASSGASVAPPYEIVCINAEKDDTKRLCTDASGARIRCP